MNPIPCHEAAAFQETGAPHDPALCADALPVGAPLHDDAYEIVRVLGRGGFGITYEACDTQRKQSVAIKEFFPIGCTRLDFGVQPHPADTRHFEATRRKFLNEARVLAGVQHRNIVNVQEAFEQNNTAYTVMELLQGETLQQRVERQGALPEAEALNIIEHICSALQTVHEMEMLHLDVKPENIFLCRRAGSHEEQRIVLMDFDLLQPMAGPASYRTQPLNVTMHCGTPGYAPLEQYTQGARFGVYTDIYALGATLCHILTGQAPTDSTDRAAHSDRAVENDIVQLNGAGDAVGHAIRWAMQLHPFKRPQSVQDFLDALHGRGVTAPDTSTQRTGAIATPHVQASSGSPTTTIAAAPAAALPRATPSSPSQPSVTAPSNASPQASMPVTPISVQPTAAPQADDLWYIVIVSGKVVEWPWMCACCGATPARTITLRASGQKYDVPYCAHCSRHVQASRLGVTGGVCGMGVGLVMAVGGVLFSNLVLGPLGTMLHFGAMSYWGLQHSFAHDLATTQCSDTRLAVAVARHTEQRIRWRFRNPGFRDEFRRINAHLVV
ncbi:MAG TPA: serine/threonine-protein kinase [Abditibacteriaceae bacterium]|jgi:serine/threonine protein kinase